MKRLLLVGFAALLPVLNAAAADVSGYWNVAGDVSGTHISMTCVFVQAEGKITGSCIAGPVAADTTGEVNGDKVTFRHSMNNSDLIFTAALDSSGQAMKGDLTRQGAAGTFSATKDKTQAAK